MIEGPGNDGVTDAPRDGHGFAGHHGLIDRRAPVDDNAVDRRLLARTDTQPIADHDCIKRYFGFLAIADAPCGLGSKVKQGANGPARALASA